MLNIIGMSGGLKMKRSEMLKKLDDIINSRQYTEYQFDEETLSSILSEIEQAGMLPPARMRYVECENGNTLCSEDCSWDEE